MANEGLVVGIPDPKNGSCHPGGDWNPGRGGQPKLLGNSSWTFDFLGYHFTFFDKIISVTWLVSWSANRLSQI